jgi:hypothetical protein
MKRVLPAERTELFNLQPFSLFFLVPRVGIIPLFAYRTAQGDDFSHSLLF